MPCGCKKKSLGTQGELNRGANGYLALHYHDNGAPYGGPGQDDSVIVVGRLTPDERIFAKDDLKVASDWAGETMRPLIIQPASNLPSEAMELFFAGETHAAEVSV